MEELISLIAKRLVDNPDEVKTVTEETDEEVIIRLSVAEGDMGKVIGKQGRIAKSLRALLRAATAKEEKKYVLEIV